MANGVGLAPLGLLAACGGGGGASSTPPPPIFTTRADTATIQAGAQLVTGNVLANDTASSGTLTVTAFAVQNGATGVIGQPLASAFGTLTMAADGAFSFAVADNAAVRSIAAERSATTQFTYTPSAGGASALPQLLTITITGINDAPVAGAAVTIQPINEGSTQVFGIAPEAIVDPDALTPLTFSATLANGAALPAWLTFDPTNRSFTASPGMSDSGIYSIRLTATDSAGASAQQLFDLQVNNVVTGVVSDGYLRQATVYIDLNGNGVGDLSDAVAISGPDGRFAIVTDAVGLLIAAGGTSVDTGLPNNVRLMAPFGSTVVNPLTTLIQAQIDQGRSAAAAEAAVKTAFGLSAALDLTRFDILAAGATDPVAVAAQKAAASIIAVLEAGVILTGTAVTQPAVLAGLSTMIASATGPVDLTDATALKTLYAGAFSDSAATELSARVASVNTMIASATSFQAIAAGQMAAGNNKAPTAANDALSTTEDAALTFDVRSNDTDADGGNLSVVALNGIKAGPGASLAVNGGLIVLGADGIFTFSPNANFSGQSTFDYVIGDGQGGSAAGSVTISVMPVNDAPTASPDTAQITEGGISVGGNVLSNDVDIDGGGLVTVTRLGGQLLALDPDPGAGAGGGYAGKLIFAAGTYGTLYLQDNGVFSYALNNSDPDTQALNFGQVANEVYTYEVSDGAASSSGTITIQIAGVGSPFGATSGNDNLVGTAGADTIFGLDGDDVIEGRGGADAIDGGSGTDTATFAGALAGVRVSLNNPALNTGDAAGDTFVGIERIVGSGFNDTLLGDSGPDAFFGEGGNDQLSGGDGSDVLDGGSGDDTIAGGLGGDQIDGGIGVDYADYGFSAEAVVVDLGSGTASGGDAAGDVLLNIEALIGSDFADTLTGSAGSNVLFGGYGADTLTGGAGADDFMFDLLLLVNGEADVVTDFQHGVDRLVMQGGDIDENFTFIAGANPVANDSGPTYLYDTTTGLLSYSVLAGGVREVAVFTGIPPLDASDIVVI